MRAKTKIDVLFPRVNVYYWGRGAGGGQGGQFFFLFCAQVCLEQKFVLRHIWYFKSGCLRSTGVRVVLARSSELCRQQRVCVEGGGSRTFGENIHARHAEACVVLQHGCKLLGVILRVSLLIGGLLFLRHLACFA